MFFFASWFGDAECIFYVICLLGAYFADVFVLHDFWLGERKLQFIIFWILPSRLYKPFARKPWLKVYGAHTGSVEKVWAGLNWLVETASLNGLSCSSTIPGGANLWKCRAVIIYAFWLVFWVVLRILTMDFNFLLSSPTVLCEDSDFQSESFQKIQWKKFELLQIFDACHEILKM